MECNDNSPQSSPHYGNFCPPYAHQISHNNERLDPKHYIDAPEKPEIKVYPAGTGEVQHNLKSLKHRNLSLEQHLGFVPSPTPKITLSSHGIEHEDCGEVRAKLFCSDCGKFQHDLVEHCDRGVCPICWKSWALKRTTESTERYRYGLKLLREINERYLSHHVVWSVPRAEYHLSYQEIRNRFHYRRKIAGSIAGLVIFHPCRFRNTKTDESVAWKHCSLNRDADTPIVDSYASYEPHFHTLSIGYLMSSDKFYERFGWTYKKITRRTVTTKDEVRSIIYYALSHCGHIEGRHSISWFGKFSNNQMLVTREEHETFVPKSECCSAPMIIEYQVNLGEIGKGFRETYAITITKKHFKFKEIKKHG